MMTTQEIRAAMERAEAVIRSRVLPDKPYSYPEELARLQSLAEFNRGSAVTMAALASDLLAARKALDNCKCRARGFHYHCPACGSTWFSTVDLDKMTTNECERCGHRYARKALEG